MDNLVAWLRGCTWLFLDLALIAEESCRDYPAIFSEVRIINSWTWG
jgi:hypothetical protein